VIVENARHPKAGQACGIRTGLPNVLHQSIHTQHMNPLKDPVSRNWQTSVFSVFSPEDKT
jgi:hypothetical protein